MVSGVRLGLLGGLLLLSACNYRLNTHRIEADIEADIERQGWRVSLNSVVCPDDVAKQAEAYFRCVGELVSGEIFTINVIQQDDEGTVLWDIPSSKTLINLVSLEEEIQTDLSKVVGQRVVISCDGAYRANERGDSFECDVVGNVTTGTDRLDSVLVRVGAEGDLSWQEVRLPTGSSAVQPVTAQAGSAQPTRPVEKGETATANATVGERPEGDDG
ncbi:MAG: hypothetical protein AAFY78_11415 [Cyanobacteria bacterium J06648_16]